MGMIFFSARSVNDAISPEPPGAGKFYGAPGGGLTSFPLATLKHIARAAQVMTKDEIVKRQIEALIQRGDARALARALDRLAAEGKLGKSWSPSDFYDERSIKKVKSRAGKRVSRRRDNREEIRAGILRRKVAVIARRVQRKYEDLCGREVDTIISHLRQSERRAPIGMSTALPALSTKKATLRQRRPRMSVDATFLAFGEALESVNEMIIALPAVGMSQSETWTKLSDLEILRALAVAMFDLIAGRADPLPPVLECVPSVRRELRRALRSERCKQLLTEILARDVALKTFLGGAGVEPN